jgi:uroporphyrinogen decarboxylase
MGYVFDAVRACRKALPADIPLIGFAGAPWTVACYAVDGGGGKEFPKARAWFHADPAGFTQVLETLADTTADYLAAQAHAGCQALQLFESWGGLLSPADYDLVVVPVLERLAQRVHAQAPDVPLILYVNGASTLLPVLTDISFDVLAVDWRMSLAQARSIVGDRPLQGNFDPCLLHAPAKTIARKVREAALGAAGGPWIANLGHGIQPDAPVEGLSALIDAVHALPSEIVP